MRQVHLDHVAWLEWSSPRGEFHGFGKQISEALGARPNATLADGGHPFDVELGRLPPGRSGCPFHSHSAQWELYIILSGIGRVRYGSESREIRAGDVALHPPGEPHQLINTGEQELTYYLVADNPLTEFWHYPDDEKWGHRPGGAIFRRTPVPYWNDGDDAEEERQVQIEPKPTSPRSRFVRLEDIPWNHRRAPRGRFESFCRDVSLALGGLRNRGVNQGAHPFDVQFRRVPPGASICPYHYHVAQWALFVIINGHGTVRSGNEHRQVHAGDVLLHPPGDAHQLTADASGELECLIVADNPPVDLFYYPDSDKWGMRPPDRFFRLTEVGYFDGEE